MLKKKEASHSRKVLEWFRDYYKGEGTHACVALEIKYAEGNSLGQSALKPHQKAALKAASGGWGLVHKLSDEVRRQQPFDAFLLRWADAFVVVVWSARAPAGLIAHAWPVAAWAGAKREHDASDLASVGGFIFHI